jgi:tetratricopeptide (TPR) repeat protein
MYEALDGDPPFKGDSSYDVMDKHLHASPRASEYLADDYFGSVILGALEKDPANRPQSAREFKEALLTLASTEKHVSNEPKQKSNANKWVTTIALVLFVVIAVALFYFRPQSQYHTTLQIEIADKRLHEYEKALSKAEKDYGPASTEAAKRLDDIASYLHLDQRKYAEAEPLWKRSLEIRERMLNVNPSAVNLLNVATSLQELAQCYFEQGKHAESTPLWERSLSIREKILGREDPVVATSVSALATNYCKQGHYKEAEPLAKRALAIFEKRFGPNDRHVLAPLFVLAECCQKQGKHAEAERLLNRAQSNQRGDVQ